MDTLLQSQGYAWGKQWTKAAEAYARLMPRVPLYDTEVWYEYAAVQLLAGDARGYRATCRRMLAPPPGTRKPRPYLVARACTLAADSADDVALAMKLCDEELTRSRSRFWSLTSAGAVLPAQRRREALPMFCRSLQAEAKRGCAVVNWLWLAIAHQELGERDEAHRWLDQSTAWLDSLRNPQAASGESWLCTCTTGWKRTCSARKWNAPSSLSAKENERSGCPPATLIRLDSRRRQRVSPPGVGQPVLNTRREEPKHKQFLSTQIERMLPCKP